MMHFKKITMNLLTIVHPFIVKTITSIGCRAQTSNTHLPRSDAFHAYKAI